MGAGGRGRAGHGAPGGDGVVRLGGNGVEGCLGDSSQVGAVRCAGGGQGKVLGAGDAPDDERTVPAGRRGPGLQGSVSPGAGGGDAGPCT